jgi:hypothetical protein
MQILRPCDTGKVGITPNISGGTMSDKKITRAEFLKSSILGIITVLFIPVLRIFNHKENVSNKNARHYKNLAG